MLLLLFRLLALKKSIKEANRELAEISQDLPQNRAVKLAVPDKDLEDLLFTINQNLASIRRERQYYQKQEQKLKEQIENISHDLRTPLTAILGYLKMMDTSDMTEENLEYLDIVIKKSYALEKLTSQFYELSRVTDENFQLPLSSVDAGRILREVCLENYGLFEKEHRTLHINSEMEAPLMIRGNADALTRIFSNLIQNSIRYSASELNICTGLCADGKMVQILFSNDIRPEQEISDPDKLFDRFYIQEQSRHQGGTGLGLTITRSLVEHMNGTITAAYAGDAQKRCLVFTMTFPRESPLM